MHVTARLLAKATLLLTLLVAVATSAWAADGRILDFEGDVRVNGQAVTADTVLKRSDTISTGADATVRIVLADNSVIDLDSDTEIHLSEYSFDPEEPAQGKSDINIAEGSLRYVSGLIAKKNADNVSFKAGNATIGVRGTFTGIQVAGVVVNVESMIGEAVVIQEAEDGQLEAVVVPTGQVGQTDASGQTALQASGTTNRVNEVVRAIAAVSPDAQSGSTDEGCSRGNSSIRRTAQPEFDPDAQAEIQAMLAELSEGELMMVIAVMNNNARHLCIDSRALDGAIREIATVRPEVAADVVFVAALIDPANADEYAETAQEAAPEQAESIQQATEAAESAREEFTSDTPAAPTDSGESPEPEEEEEPEPEEETEPEDPGEDDTGGAPSPE